MSTRQPSHLRLWGKNPLANSGLEWAESRPLAEVLVSMLHVACSQVPEPTECVCVVVVLFGF